MHFLPSTTISLALGFSPVLTRRGQVSRFNGLFAPAEAAKAALASADNAVTGLKPGANERIAGPNIFLKTCHSSSFNPRHGTHCPA
jgi:hypothetical protein